MTLPIFWTFLLLLLLLFPPRNTKSCAQKGRRRGRGIAGVGGAFRCRVGALHAGSVFESSRTNTLPYIFLKKYSFSGACDDYLRKNGTSPPVFEKKIKKAFPLKPCIVKKFLAKNTIVKNCFYKSSTREFPLTKSGLSSSVKGELRSYLHAPAAKGK